MRFGSRRWQHRHAIAALVLGHVERLVGQADQVVRAQIRIRPPAGGPEAARDLMRHVADHHWLIGQRHSQAFALIGRATIVAAGGLYSLLTFLIRGARQEWAIRLAVGATSRDLQKLVLRQSVAYAAAGSAVGIVLLIALASPLSDALYGVTVWDPVVAGGTALLLALVSVSAAALPARDAARVAPAELLR